MATDKCYSVGNNTAALTNQYFSCGTKSSKGGQSCCLAGDYCMEGNICHYTHDVVNGTGYYMSGCTDPTWQDPACPKQCTSQFGEDVVYDTTNKRWLCCTVTKDGRDCRNLPNLTPIDAPAPDKLSLIRQINTPAPTATSTSIVGPISVATTSNIPQNTASSARPTTTMTSGAQATQSATQTPDDVGLSAGAKAGIGIGIVLAAMILAALGVYLLWSKRKHRRRQMQHQQLHGGSSNEFQEMHEHNQYHQPRSTTPYGELDSVDPSSYYAQQAKHDAYAESAPEPVATMNHGRNAVLGAHELPSEMYDNRDVKGRYGRYSTTPRELDGGSERMIGELEGSRREVYEKAADGGRF